MEGRRLLATFLVTSTADGGAGTLRQAIIDADTLAGGDAIAFNLPGTGLQTITLNSALPTINEALTIDATTQPGYTNRPLVQIVPGAGAGADGLSISGNDSTVKGLQIVGFSDAQVLLTGQRNVIAGNILGAAGSSAPSPEHAGVIVRGSDNTIGGTTAAARNLIGGAGWGVSIETPGASGNVVSGNLFGSLSGFQQGVAIINATNNTIGGTTAGAANTIAGGTVTQVTIIGPGATSNRVLGNKIGDANTTGVGVLITGGAAANVVGGTDPNAGNTFVSLRGVGITIGGGATGNLVQANQFGPVTGPGTVADGVVISDATNNTIGGGTLQARNIIGYRGTGNGVVIGGAGATGNVVQGNFLGVDATGTHAAPNANGVVVNAPGNLIGGSAAGLGNVISGNLGAGVVLGPGAVGGRVQGNYLGVDFTGAAALGNGGPGIFLVGARSNVIGGTDLAARNLVSANAGPGLSLADGPGATGSVGNIIWGNFVGTDLTGKLALANGGAGIRLTDHATSNLIGGSKPGAPNLISANRGGGVELIGAGVAGNAIQGNLIGVTADGTAALANVGDGVRIDGGAGNSVGGGFAGAGNLISGNAGNGLSLIGGATRSLVQGNDVGVDVSGASALPNRGLGLLVLGGGNVVGGAISAQRNVISGNGSTGILVQGGAGNVLQGNFLGTDTSGTGVLGNGGFGLIVADAPGTIVGGPAPGLGNVVSGNAGGGIAFVGNVAFSQVQGNFVGADASGQAAPGNGVVGVLLAGGGVTFGGSSRFVGNVVAGNRGAGIQITAGAPVNVIQGNLIGTDASGRLALGNVGAGIQVDSVVNQIGGTAPGAGNVIAHNGGAGVDVTSPSARSVSIVSNFLFANGGPSIRLAPGANGGIAPPTLAVPTLSGGTTIIRGRFVGRAGATYLIQLFLGQGDARIQLGSIGVTTDTSGRASFSATSPTTIPAGQVVVATATDTQGNTSMLSGPYAPTPRVAAMVLTGGRIAVGFTADMDPTTADNVANYAVLASGPDGRFGTADDVLIPIQSATYDAPTRIVFLTPARAIGRGQLVAVAVGVASGPGLVDLTGTPLDGDSNGTPGGTFVGIIGPA